MASVENMGLGACGTETKMTKKSGHCSSESLEKNVWVFSLL